MSENVSNLTHLCVKLEICKIILFCYHIDSSRDKPYRMYLAALP
nr:MAG TPA: hypothetical protein [Caudoviricetes sp.]